MEDNSSIQLIGDKPVHVIVVLTGGNKATLLGALPWICVLPKNNLHPCSLTGKLNMVNKVGDSDRGNHNVQPPFVI